MALSKSAPINVNVRTQTPIPVAASTEVFQGGAISFDGTSGDASPLVAGEAFAGFALETVDNTDGSAGERVVLVATDGVVGLPSIAGASTGQALVNDVVYASDDNTFTLTASTNTAIGKIVSFVDGTYFVAFQAEPLRIDNPA